MRVSETLGLRIADVCIDSGAHVRCHGKGRKARVTPLTVQTVAVLHVWLRERGALEFDEVMEPSLGLAPGVRFEQLVGVGGGFEREPGGGTVSSVNDVREVPGRSAVCTRCGGRL